MERITIELRNKSKREMLLKILNAEPFAGAAAFGNGPEPFVYGVKPYGKYAKPYGKWG
ncbi:hypothetical protein [Parapedobacter tibetensis]|uniref:hypothetical protein n=1 Tax=Parapedobacter tibetensis TaxID=2972951 RepID=UPI00214DA8D8|nr:hypothetical protein [Parapedobacter tibetensis]